MSINFDKAATTRLKEEVLNEMLPYLNEFYANASSIYSPAQKSKEKIESSRMKISSALGCKPSEIYFTSGGTESDNWAIKGIADSLREKGNHIITSKIEHHAILNSAYFLEERGYRVTYLNVDIDGFISLKELEDSICDETILISTMLANNEIGTIEPIEEIGKIAKEKNVIYHVDAVQALGNLPIDLKNLDVDLMSFSGHKINGPAGVGVLYIKDKTKITPLLHGGAQEKSKRAGTENVAGIIGMGKAVELAVENINGKIDYISKMRNKLIENLLSIDGVTLNGSLENRLPGNVNVSIEGVDSQEMLIFLDRKDICASSGSACNTGSIKPSHVLKALGLSDELAKDCLRLTLDSENTLEEVEEVSKEIKKIIKILRK
ncbi:cysteine desulfurase [Anaerosphaera aminiphila DSM 21120]|uniref:cysteine desulfurase n=1 Tax=Anaerosphaera aminiphila DSM 21120 TaxID=1120995 RepID=A0A1M5NNB1_9FIRM|nr:cysteine desulfurase family protein [Anaerosphaera aminiphila]SHG90935.1 cysteine desulfurase [Anaerosphaera aminiphila DSM 21120]